MKLFSSSHTTKKGTRHPELLLFFMLLTILVIAGFQAYWLRDNYNREKQNLEIKTNSAFRQTILRLQASKLKLETANIHLVDSAPMAARPLPVTVRMRAHDRDNKGRGKENDARVAVSPSRNEPVISIVNLIQEKIREIDFPDSISHAYGRVVLTGLKDSLNKVADSLNHYFKKSFRVNGSTVMNHINLDNLDSLVDPEMIRSMTIERPKSGKRPPVTVTYSGDIAYADDPSKPVPPVPLMPLPPNNPRDTARNSVIRFLYNVDSLSLKDSVTVKEVDSAYAKRLALEKINVGFAVNRVAKANPDSAAFNQVTVGFSNPMTYELALNNQTSFILGRLKMPILFSLLLVGITIASFVALYRSLMKQHRLAQIKNDLISNITHELKTPIATVSVAIEALKNFNAIQDPARTREYLDISQNELQRLGLLVDKVLKLSMFEKKDIELKSEYFDLKDVLNEVVASLRLQLEKYHAKLDIHTEGETSLKGDRLHMLSVVFNLLDNALKYSKENPHIEVSLKQVDEQVELEVKDNGIGIPTQYKDKVFDKFFRVPAGDTHNAKGHGLGLSYVAQVIRKHNGTIKVDSREGLGSTFTVILPKQNT